MMKSNEPKVSKYPLDLELYEHYGIDQRYQAYIVKYTAITLYECDNFESDYTSQGHKIFHVATKIAEKQGLYDLELVIAKARYQF